MLERRLTGTIGAVRMRVAERGLTVARGLPNPARGLTVARGLPNPARGARPS